MSSLYFAFVSPTGRGNAIVKRSFVIDHAGIYVLIPSVGRVSGCRGIAYAVPHESSRIKILMRFDENVNPSVGALFDELGDLGEVLLVVVTLLRLHSDPGNG